MTDNTNHEQTDQDALALLHDHYDLEDCSRCEIREEFGLVLGDSDCAIGVAVCPHCGYHSRLLIADPTGVATDWPYSEMYDRAMEWVPPWHPGHEDVTADWTCACGKTWHDYDDARLHVLKDHPDRSNLSMHEHDRYPWKNTTLNGADIQPDS